MDRSRAPYEAQDSLEVKKVINDMERQATKGGKKGVKRKKYSTQDGRQVTSWNVPDWDYKKAGLPTYARGLFTQTTPKGGHEIVCRGYDKFFNVGEVRETEWRNVEQNTLGPYELSVKENGCIIFIGALDDTTLLVTSKHATGPRDDDSANHALAGEQWLDKQLTQLNKTRADLAKRLRSMNATAVAELCDDAFEEHVLRYDPNQAGLYLHGINLNLPEFATYPGNLVNAFADEWGFRRVMYVIEDNIQNVKTFLDKVAETGNYDGRDTEGFVVRCKTRDHDKGGYHDWFFKYKFEEPYLMYRQWREVTKSAIAGKPPRYKKHKQITEEYLLYARRQLHKNPQLARDFNKNHGIIAMREGFLAEKGVKGSDIIRMEESEGDVAASNVTSDVVLVPIATIGCGKTTVATALTKLFDWGHEQNDNVTGKGSRAQRFVTAVTNTMSAHAVVIADRNNHQRREREQILHDIRRIVPGAKIVALHWVHDRSNLDQIRKVNQERVLSRGDNHQTIQAITKGPQEVIGIMEGFIGRFEPLNIERAPDNGFDHAIDLDPIATSRENLQTVIEALHDEYPKLFRMPTDEQMDEAINWALNEYKPELKHDLSGAFGGGKKEKAQQTKQPPAAQQPKPPKKAELEYFALQLKVSEIDRILHAVFNNEPNEVGRFYIQLKATRRIQQAFHVTLIHRADMQRHTPYWQKLVDVWHDKQLQRPALANGSSPQPADLNVLNVDPNLVMGTARVHLETVVWDGRVMAIACRLPDSHAEPGFHTVNEMAHITIGTASDSIKPKESNDLLRSWLQDSPNIQSVKVRGSVILDGEVKGVLRR